MNLLLYILIFDMFLFFSLSVCLSSFLHLGFLFGNGLMHLSVLAVIKTRCRCCCCCCFCCHYCVLCVLIVPFWPIGLNWTAAISCCIVKLHSHSKANHSHTHSAHSRTYALWTRAHNTERTLILFTVRTPKNFTMTLSI